MSLYILVAILWAVVIPSNSLESLNYTTTPVDKNVGLYYEPMHQIRFTTAEWRLVTFIDMKKFESQKPFINESVIRQHVRRCKIYMSAERCHGLINRDYIRAKNVIAHKYIEQIRAFVNLENKAFINDDAEIMKRSVPFGFIGSISKALFGTMDTDDARYYNEQIDELYADQKNITKLVEKQAHLVKSGFHHLHDELETMKTKSAKVDGLLKDVLYALNKTMSTRNYFALLLQIDEWARHQELEIDNYVNNLELIIEAVYFAKLGFIHPGLITPKILEQSVNHFKQNHHSTNTAFPISIEEVRAGGLGKISRTAIGYHDGKLFLVMHVPLVEHRIYNLYKMHPFPIAQTYGNNEKGAAYVQPRTSYLIVSQEQNKYTLINEAELPHCQNANGYYICTPSYPLYEVSTQPICEISLITKHSNQGLDDCNIRMSKIFNPHWKQLHNMKGWLYSLPKEEEIHIVCGSWKETIGVSGAGILTLKPGCSAHTAYATFMGYEVINQTGTYEFNPVTRLNVTEIFPEIVNYEPLGTPADIPRVTSTVNVPGVLSYDTTLDEIQKDMKEIGEHKREKQKQEKIVFWTIVGEIILASGFLCYLGRVSFVLLLYYCNSRKSGDIDEPSVTFQAKNNEPSVNIDFKNTNNDKRVYATPSNVVF